MLSHFEGTIIEEQGKKIAVVAVQQAVFKNSSDAITIIKSLLPIFNGIPVVLVTKDTTGKPAYLGRGDLIGLLENVNLSEASWQQYTAELILNNSCPAKDMEDN